jgi:hypothetical protein
MPVFKVAPVFLSHQFSAVPVFIVVLMSLNSIEVLVFNAETSFLSLELFYFFSLCSNACLDVSQLSAVPVFIPYLSVVPPMHLLVFPVFLSLHLTAVPVFIALMSHSSQWCLYFHCIAFVYLKSHRSLCLH